MFEDGVKQDVTFFNRTNLPIALALLMDTSASMETRLPIAQEAAVGFARRLRPQDLAEVIDFDSRVIILQPFTNDATALEQAIRRTSAGGSTSMYNAIYIALKELKKIIAEQRGRDRRQAIVVLSDGEDTSSLHAVRRGARSRQAVGNRHLRHRPPRSAESAGARGFKEAEFVLRQLAQETGGRAFFPRPSPSWRASTRRSPTSSRASTRVGYTSKNTKRDGAWRRIVVRVDRPNSPPAPSRATSPRRAD